ncbi:MAG TPA: hypothetical protein VMW53_12200 [archaeon]|nr:hypothetical protein [archaeon]
MAYSAYCDTAIATKWWITGVGSTVNRLSEVMDDNASGVEEADNPGNYQPWTTFMTEVIEDVIYLIHVSFELGNETTATTLLSTKEYVRFDDTMSFYQAANSVFTLGELVADFGLNGSYWSLSGADSTNLFTYGSEFNIYSSILECRSSTQYIYSATSVKVRNSIFRHVSGTIDNYRNRHRFQTAPDIKGLFYENAQSLYLANDPINFENVIIHNCYYGVQPINVNLNLTGLRFENIGYEEIYDATTLSDKTIHIIDPYYNLTSVRISRITCTIDEQYTCNITVRNNTGTLLDGVEVLCEDEADATVWTTTTGDTDTGKIDEQVITYKMWTGTSETLTEYSPHKFTFSKAGYETLILENITVDHPIVWELKLKGVTRFKEDGVTYFKDDS